MERSVHNAVRQRAVPELVCTGITITNSCNGTVLANYGNGSGTKTSDSASYAAQSPVYIFKDISFSNAQLTTLPTATTPRFLSRLRWR